MPLALRDWQAAFAADLIGDAPDAGTRLAIHRHHVASSLVRALAVSFPTVEALVGAAFFGQAARVFAAQDPPTQPVLAEYGAGFADFIAAHAPAQGLPYLADMARLDWALNVAFHSPRGPRLTAANLSVLPADRLATLSLRLAAGTALVCSRYPIDEIWRASRPDAADRQVDLAGGAARLLVLRGIDGAAFVALDAGEAAFIAAVGEGRSLETAAGAASRTDASFDLSRAFARLVGCEVFAALQQ